MDPKDNEELTEYCFNCRRNIPLGNHVMHSAYCHRNLKLCLKCDEPFLTSEYEKHLETMHTDILCKDCSKKLEAKDLELHKLNDCPHRLQTCNFCEIDVNASLLPAHSDMCSSRTERCDDCGQFIMLKYLAFHKESHKLKKIPNVAKPVLDDSPESLAAYPPLTKKVPNATVDGTARSTTRTTSMPSLRPHEPLMTNHRVSAPVKRNNDQPQINMHNNNNNSHKNPKKNLPITDTPRNDDDFSVLGAHSVHNQSTNVNNYLRNEYNDFTSVLKGVQLPCEFCQRMIDSESLVLHETGCRPDLAAFHNILHTNNKNTNNLNEEYPVSPLDLDNSSDDSLVNLNTLNLSSDDDDSEKTNVEKLPCEFCEELIPIKKLIDHQVKCEKIHLNLPVVNNIKKEVCTRFDVYSSDVLSTKLSKPVDNREHKRHNLLFKQKSDPVNPSNKTLVLRNPDGNAQLPTSSMTQMLPRVKLNKFSSNQINVPANNGYMNNSARNSYEQFLSNSRSNHLEQQTTTQDNSRLYLNPSGGAIPKRKNFKSKSNQKVINNLSKRRDSGSSSD